MNNSIIKSVQAYDLDTMLFEVYLNIKHINKLFNNYIQTFKYRENDYTMDITTTKSKSLLHAALNKYITTNTLFTEVSLLRQIILNLVEFFVENRVKVIDEFKDDERKDTSYHLVVCDTLDKIKVFILYILLYRVESSVRVNVYKDKRRRAFVGIDYEFAQQKIALMQINFENIKTKAKMINYMFIIDPTELEDLQMHLLVRKLMENKQIFKIFHGADSLDMPYTLNEMFAKDTKIIKKFMKKFVDTRFLCEYLKGSIDNNKKCTIYEALRYFGTIDEAKLAYLIKTHDSMGPIQHIAWNIHKLSPFHRKYAFYDVIYLPRLFSDIYKRAYEKTPLEFQFYRYLNEVTRFVMKEKRGVTSITSDIKLEVDPMNNIILQIGDNNLTFIAIFNQILYNIKLNSIKFDSALLLNINYFKSTLVLLLKKITYHILTQDYTVYINKKNTPATVIPLDDLYDTLRQHNYDKINLIVELLHVEIKRKIKQYFKENKNK